LIGASINVSGDGNIGGALAVTGNALFSADLSVTGTASIAGNLSVAGTITGNLTGSVNPGFATGSVVFQGASGLAENNANFFWDNTNNRLGIGTTTPSAPLHIVLPGKQE
jgi:trimeric autotransporter adhesin